MPHKDRERRLAYLRAWKARHRPAPIAEPQINPALAPRGRMAFSADGERVQCHYCGGWYRSLNTHLKTHGLDAEAYKEMFDLPRTASLWPPALQQKQRDLAIERGQGEIGRQWLEPTGGRKKGAPSRLGTRINASEQRSGIYTRGGQKARPAKAKGHDDDKG